METNHFDYHKRQPCAYRKCNCASISIQLLSSVKPKMFGDQTRLNMFGHKTVPVFHDVASYNRVSNKPSNRNSLKLITTGRTSFFEPARLSTRSKSLFKTTGQHLVQFIAIIIFTSNAPISRKKTGSRYPLF